jgi:hypothetical protein
MEAAVDHAALRDGFNEITLTPQDAAATVVWLEVRITP